MPQRLQLSYAALDTRSQLRSCFWATFMMLVVRFGEQNGSFWNSLSSRGCLEKTRRQLFQHKRWFGFLCPINGTKLWWFKIALRNKREFFFHLSRNGRPRTLGVQVEISQTQTSQNLDPCQFKDWPQYPFLCPSGETCYFSEVVQYFSDITSILTGEWTGNVRG